MVFHRKGALINASILLILLFAMTYGQNQNPTQSNSRSYDTNDWIPVSRPAAPGEGRQPEAVQKRPTGRVLNLPSQDEKIFFAVEQQTAANPQQYRLPPDTVKHQQPQLLHSQRQFQPQPTYVPNGQQQILLPPQLQSLISQGQPYISPQNINQQLLHTPTQGYSTVPTQNFPLNTSDFNSKEIIQNINLGLYNQQPITQQVHQSKPIQQQPQQVKLQHNNEQPEIQLLYVPLENLQRQRGQRQQVVFPTEQSVAAPQIYNPLPQQQYQSPVQHKQVQLQNIEQDFVQQALQAQKLQEQFQHNVQTAQAQTMPALKKRKPHQPPLAVYMGTEGQDDIKIGDVLSILKDAKSISVQDTVGPDSPQVFVGPSHLEPPDGYMKFDLPYLSSIENNRVERKVDQLPFFVAPLSYKAPPGYSKIPFPAPHVGSVVINHLKATPSTTTEHTRFIHSQTLEDTSSHIPFSQSEVSTIRSTRGRQRQPSRNSFTASTVQTPVSAEIPYGPLPTRVTPEVQQPHSVQESLISPNPYGPTRFVQSTTPAIYDKPVNLPEEIFSTKNRFITTPPAYNNYNIQNVPTRQSQYSHHHDADPTEPTLASSTLSSNLINDQYTVLEQFPIGGKQQVKQIEESVPPPRIPSRQHSRHPTQQPYHQEPSEKTALPLISSTHFSNQNEFESQTPYRQQFIQQETPTRQRLQNYEQIPTKQTYQETTKQRVPEIHQEVPTLQRVTETYQEVPIRQRITENYQAVQHSTQSSPVQQILHQEQISTQQSHPDFELPVRHVTQESQFRGQQQFISQNYDRDLPLNHNIQFTSQAQTQRTRGKQHFTPDTYFQEDFDQHINEKTTEPLITVTKEPVVEYKIPEEQSHLVPDTRGQQHHQQLIHDNYYQDEPQRDIIQSKLEYTLPAKLPPISPQLPGLINSLQDQQIRPLLAPLLLPPSEQTPVEDSSPESLEEYYPSPEPVSVHIPVSTPTTTTTTTTTSAPITVETTTQFKRLRGRQRVTRPTVAYDYVSTTATPRRPTQYRGRRPYNGQSRQEYKSRESYPVSSTSRPEIINESTTRAVYNRNRHAPQRLSFSSTTEQPRRSPSPPSSRQKFRTRGRPMKIEEEYIESNTPENVPVFKQPVLEGGFQAASPLLQQSVQLTVPTTHITDHEGNVRDEPVVSQRSQKEQALIYIQNNNKPISQDTNSDPDVYIPRQQFISSTEALEPLHQSTITATGPENNFVPDVIHDQPVLLSTQQNVKYNNPTEKNLNSQEDYNVKEDKNGQIPQIKYNLEPEIKEQSTTESTRSRSRIRVKTRGRINPVVSTARYQPSYSSSTTHRTTTEEAEQEFYGFFRQPNFGKTPQTEKPRSEYVLNTPQPSLRPNVVYLDRSSEQPQQQRYYVNSENNPIISSPKPYLPVTHIEDSYVQPNIQVQRQYISSTVAPTISASEESVIDIKPVTRRPHIRTRRPITSHVRTAEISAVSEQSNEKYHTRPTRRPEVQTPRPTRIRMRIRKPTHSTTAHSPEIQNSYSHSPKTNELDNNNSEEYVTPVKTRQRLTTSRGKSHFQGPRSEKISEPEEENYPASFLQGHGIQQSSPSSIISYSTPAASTPQSIVLTTPDPVTARPAFQLTIEPEDADEEYPDQIPYSSVNQPSLTNKDLEEGLEETKFSAKFVEKPSNFNYIVSNDKPISTTEKYVKTTTENTKTEETEDADPQLTTSKTAGETMQPSETTTTDLPSTTTESITETPKGRRRGVWRLVNARPVGDDFESAESQNIESVFSDNEFTYHAKPIRKYKVVQRIHTSTEPFQYESTTQNIPETTFRQPSEIITQKLEESSTTENNIFGPLYEMFGYNSEQHLNEENLEINEDNDATTTENPIMSNTILDEVESTTLLNTNSTETPTLANEDMMMTYSDIKQKKEEPSMSDEAWRSRIIGTSTTTEISHETEICYRGRCIKSASIEENSGEML